VRAPKWERREDVLTTYKVKGELTSTHTLMERGKGGEGIKSAFEVTTLVDEGDPPPPFSVWEKGKGGTRKKSGDRT